MKDILKASVKDIADSLSRGELSSVELTRGYIRQIEKTEPEINAFITVCAEQALREAALADKRRAEGRVKGILDGIPFAVKDNICVKGVAATCASRILEGFIPPYSATAAQRISEAGGVLLGKLNMDEFAMGTRSDTSAFGAVRNPLNPAKTAGGSSGGSAAAIAAREATFTLGSDTGGSARLPAAYCGAVAMKPTYGTVSRYGLIAFAPSLEQICPVTADVFSNAVVLETIMGNDPQDATSLERTDRFLKDISQGAQGLRIGVDTSAISSCDDDVKAAYESIVKTFAELGASIIPIKLPDTDASLAAYRIISCAEAYSNLARFDGARYGRRARDAESIDELFIKSRSEGFGKEVKNRILLGAYALGDGGREKYYLSASAYRQRLRASLDEILTACDAILTPTAVACAPNVNDTYAEEYREDRFCVMANLSGLPAVTFPYGRGKDGMSVGIQLMGAAFSEAKLYRIAYAAETAAEQKEGKNG